MSRLYDRLTGTAGSGEDAEIGAGPLRSWLEHGTYRWLVVFDNAEPEVLDGVEQAAAYIRQTRSTCRDYSQALRTDPRRLPS